MWNSVDGVSEQGSVKNGDNELGSGAIGQGVGKNCLDELGDAQQDESSDDVESGDDGDDNNMSESSSVEAADKEAEDTGE